MIINLQNSNQPGSHWIALKRVNNTIFVFDSFGIGDIPVGIFKLYKNYKNNNKYLSNPRCFK